MAQLINEAKRMQQLAGLINESQLNEVEQTNEIFGLGAEKVEDGDTILFYNDKPVSEENPNNIVKVVLNWQGDGGLVSPSEIQSSSSGIMSKKGDGVVDLDFGKNKIAVGDKYFNSVNPKDWEGELEDMRKNKPKITKIEVIKKGQSQPKSVKKIQFAPSQNESINIESTVNEALAKFRKTGK
jgi:hypothetical protein